jgi:hypothetical protein
MRKTAINTLVCSLFLTLISLLFLNYDASAQIVLLDEPIPIKPTGFYIAGVQDNRHDKTKPADIIIKSATNKLVSESMGLEGGTAGAIKRYIDKNLPKNSSGRPVIICIEQLKLQETVLSEGSIEGRLNLKLSFSLEKDYGLEPLITYPGALRYRRSPTAQITVERNLRRMIGSGLSYFDEWMKANLGSDRKLARAVKISFTDYQNKTAGDTIYYDPKRPLTWADFQSRNKPPGMYQASVMPSIGYTQDADLENGTLLVRIAVKAYVPKSACWANPTDRNDYYLNHEQRHFDIAKIIAEQFKKKVLAKKLTPDDYEGFINMQYLDSYRDMNVMQKAYDDETNHGINRFAQDTWNARIDKELQMK